MCYCLPNMSHLSLTVGATTAARAFVPVRVTQEQPTRTWTQRGHHEEVHPRRGAASAVRGALAPARHLITTVVVSTSTSASAYPPQPLVAVAHDTPTLVRPRRWLAARLHAAHGVWIVFQRPARREPQQRRRHAQQ